MKKELDIVRADMLDAVDDILTPEQFEEFQQLQRTVNFTPFLSALERIPGGYSQGLYAGRRWGATLIEAAGGRRFKLFAEELGGRDFVSFNLYLTGDGTPQLKPCEMPAAKVIDFVLGYESEG